MNERTFVLKGTICYSNSLTELSITENGYLVCEDGRCAGVFDELPEKFAGISCTDFGNELIIPGLTDLHLHAPQYTFRASGMDLELLDWLNTYTFPQEARYEDTEFAKEAYSIFAEDMKKSPNTRACIFGTLHVPATEILMEQLDKTGIKAMVGKVNMDRNGSPQLQEESAQVSAAALAHSPPLEIRYPIARNTYMKPMVAIIGGTSALEITKPTTAPQAAPIAIAMTNATNVFEICSYFRSIPIAIPDNASVDMIEISIPPTNITHNIPSDITSVTALFFKSSVRDFQVRNDGLITVTTAHSRIRMTASNTSREPVIFFKTDFFSIISLPPLLNYGFSPLPVQGFSPVLPLLL